MYFDEKAKTWDNNSEKIERANVFAKEIRKFIQFNKDLNALEFGSGTGLLSFCLKDYFKQITLVDSSQGMIEVLKEKIDKEGVGNFLPLQIDLFDRKIKFSQIDVIYSLMTMHHISNIDVALKRFNEILEPKGYLCIADLVKEDGSFHAAHPNFDGHNGFDRDELSDQMRQNGFDPIYYNECYTIKKEVNKELKEYPLFLMIAKKYTHNLQ